MGIAVFDHDRFNHTFVAGHLSYKIASRRAGYAFGFERPLFGATKLYLGGELHDLTASDDQWQVSSLEAGLAAAGPRRSFRDYYRRRGVQINAAVRLHPQVEALLAWRGERQEPLTTSSDFSLWNGDDPFRPNTLARDGRLNALIVGLSVDGRSFDRESLEATYRRHQLDTLFGERLNEFDSRRDAATVWRLDWTSEFSEPGAFGSDFDFQRHIVSGRSRLRLSPHQVLGVRGIGGWSAGILPPQRQFAVGGIGSVHGYDFKEQAGDTLALVNLEYEVGWRGGLKAIGFFDAGRVTSRQIQAVGPSAATAPWLEGIGWGVGVGDFRIDFGYRAAEIPGSLRVVVRFGPTF
jgi:outer membrane protein assembly factor BamA